LPYIWALDL